MFHIKPEVQTWSTINNLSSYLTLIFLGFFRHVKFDGLKNKL